LAGFKTGSSSGSTRSPVKPAPALAPREALPNRVLHDSSAGGAPEIALSEAQRRRGSLKSSHPFDLLALARGMEMEAAGVSATRRPEAEDAVPDASLRQRRRRPSARARGAGRRRMLAVGSGGPRGQRWESKQSWPVRPVASADAGPRWPSQGWAALEC
jgi:hypothetical protein